MTQSNPAILSIKLKSEHPDWGITKIAEEIGVPGFDRYKVRRAIEGAARKQYLPAVQGQGGQLAWYEAARHALTQAVAIDEVKTIRDKAAALKVYAQQAKERELIDKATDIKMRAEIRSGEILREMAATRARAARGHNDREISPRVTLPELDISRMQSSRWQELAALPKAEQEAKIAKAKRIAVATIDGDKEILKEARVEKQQEKKERRAIREQVLGGIQCALPQKRYGVILADPEWRFEPWSRTTGMDRAADNHYPTSVLERIQQRDVASIAADDCVLFLWATIPMLPQAIMVMGAWGFDYKSAFGWVKELIGTGYWSRNNLELLLIGVRGDIPAPAPGTQWPTAFEAPVGRHSEKPDRVYELIEAYFPTLPKIELNARRPRPGWDSWGNESTHQQEAAE